MRNFANKRDWVRAHMGDVTSDAEFLSAFAKEFRFKSEQRAADELKEILASDAAVEEGFSSSTNARLYSLGQKLLTEMRAAGAYGPASVVWRSMASLKGLDQPQRVEVAVSGAPAPDVVRARIAALMASRQVQENAQAIGVVIEGDQLSFRAQMLRRNGVAVLPAPARVIEVPIEETPVALAGPEADADRLRKRLAETRAEHIATDDDSVAS